MGDKLLVEEIILNFLKIGLKNWS